MLERLRLRHHGATIAIVGSASTATLYDPSDSDISIGVNGAALLGHRFDYFACADRMAPERDWFAVNCAPCRVIARAIASCDRQLYPDRFDIFLPHREAFAFEDQDKAMLPEPVPPHCIYTMLPVNDANFSALAEREASGLMAHATITGQAVQLAWLLGAAHLRLYGCRFSTETSGRPFHYFYRAEPSQTGQISARQRDTMDRYLALLRRLGVRVTSHGETCLTEYDENIR